MFASYSVRTGAALSCLGLLLALGASGCGGADEGNSVTGTVKLDGKPLTGGTITFVGQEGDKTPIFSIIQGNGSYSIPRAPSGAIKIAVQGPGRSSGGQEAAPAVLVPAKYANAETSGLEYTVTKGKQTHDIELTP